MDDRPQNTKSDASLNDRMALSKIRAARKK